MDKKSFTPGDSRSISMAEDFLRGIGGESVSCKYNRVLEDIARVYDNAILVGAVAAAKYIDDPHEPRVTYDVDVLISEKDFSDPRKANPSVKAWFGASWTTGARRPIICRTGRPA